MSAIFNFFPQEVVASIGWTLLHSLWQGGVIAFLLFLSLYIARNKNSNLKALFSTIALGFMLAAAIVTFSIKYNSAVSAEYTDSSISMSGAEINLIAGELQNKINSFGPLAKIYNSFLRYFNSSIPLIVSLWMAGFLFFAIRFAGGVFYTARIRKKITIIEDEFLLECFTKPADKINLKKKIIFAQSALIKVPVVLGYIKPMILLPFGLISGLPLDQVEAIIAHEIAHIKRYDLVINLLQSIVEIIFFYNPFVWYISYKIKAERENACDDIAVELCGNSVLYAKALANAESFKKSNEPLFAIPLFKNQNQLLRRIKRMLRKDENQNSFKEKFVAVLIFIGILVTAAALKNFNTASTGDGQTIKAGISFPASLFVGGKELSGIELDTAKAFHGKRSFSYFQKEDGKMKRYKAKIEDGKLTGLSIDGEKVPGDKLDNYRKDVEEAFSKLDEEFPSRNRGIIDDSSIFNKIFSDDSLQILSKYIAENVKESMKQFESQEFKMNMEELRKKLKQNEKELKDYFNSDEYKKGMEEYGKAMKEYSAQMKDYFNSDEFKKEMKDCRKGIDEYFKSDEYKESLKEMKNELERLKKEMKENKFHFENEFNSEAFKEQREKTKEQLDKMFKELSGSRKHVNAELFKSLDSLKGVAKLKHFDNSKLLESLKKNEFAMKGFDKNMKEFNEKMKGFGEKMKVFGEKMKIFGKFIKEVRDLLVDEKLIEEDDNNPNIDIKKDGLFIDGKKQSDAVFQKVKDIYKKYYNKEFDDEFHFNTNSN